MAPLGRESLASLPREFTHAKPPRVSCPDHGVKQARMPWAEPGSRFTHLFEVLAIDVLKATNVKQGAALLRLTWDEAWHLMERAVSRGRSAKGAAIPALIGVYEKAIAKGHRYMTLVCDLKEATVEYIGDERRETSLAAYFEAFPEERRAAIEAVSLDMWPAFINACTNQIPGADQKMVFDRFHVMRHVIDAVDKVRKTENKALLSQGDATLIKSKYLWLYSAENVPERSREHFNAIKTMELKTARAWAIKEALRQLWSYKSTGWATRFWKRWYFWATHSRLASIIEAAKLIERHLPKVLNYFKHRITNVLPRV
jgi:transposase